MVLLLPLLMAYSLIGERFHEIAGTAMLILFLIHHWWNRGWLRNLFRGKHPPRRIFQQCLDLLLLIFMILQPLCGILMSKHLYAFLPTDGVTALARSIHLPLAYWGFVLLSIHAGTHLDAMLRNGKGKTAVLAGMTLVSLYGIFAFVKRQFPGYMFLKNAFVFFDYSESRILFLLDYLAVLILFAIVGYGIMTLLKSTGQSEERP